MASNTEYVVTQPYTPQHDGEISLSYGDKLCDIKDLGNGWTLGKNLTNNSVGIFPHNHVSLVVERGGGASLYPSSSSAAEVTRLSPPPEYDDNDDNTTYLPDHNQTEVKTPVQSNFVECSSPLDSLSHTPRKPPPAAPIKTSSSRDSLSSAAGPSSRQPPSRRSDQRGRSSATPVRQSPVAQRRVVPPENRHSLRLQPQDYQSQNLPSHLNLGPSSTSLPSLAREGTPQREARPQREADTSATVSPVIVTECRVAPCLPNPPPPPPPHHGHNITPQTQPNSAEKPQVAVKPNANRVIFSPSSGENLPLQEDFEDLPASASEVNIIDVPQSSYVNTAQTTPLSHRIRVGAPRGYVALSESHNRLPVYVDIDASSIDIQNTSNMYRESPEIDRSQCRKPPDEYRDYRSLKYAFSEEGSTSTYSMQPRSRASLARQQRNTTRDRNDGLKTVFSLIVSLVLGGLIFLWMYYELNYIIHAAAATAGLAAIFMCCAFALSLHCRCLTALLLPNLFTKLGRLAYLCILSGLLLSGPIMNIYRNTREASASMSCSAQLTYNQTKQIYTLMHKPYSAILAGLNDTVSRLQVAAGNVTQELHPLKDGLHSAQDGVNEGYTALYDTHAVSSSFSYKNIETYISYLE